MSNTRRWRARRATSCREKAVRCGIIFAIRSYYATAPGRLQLDSLLLKAPVLLYACTTT